jgi:hypothetical protein
MKRVDELRRHDSDHAAVPPFPTDDQDGSGADVRIGLNDLLRGGQDLRFFFLPPHVLAVQLQRELARSSAIVSSAASSSRVAMSGVLMRPAALTRGATMKPMW